MDYDIHIYIYIIMCRYIYMHGTARVFTQNNVVTILEISHIITV